MSFCEALFMTCDVQWLSSCYLLTFGALWWAMMWPGRLRHSTMCTGSPIRSLLFYDARWAPRMYYGVLLCSMAPDNALLCFVMFHVFLWLYVAVDDVRSRPCCSVIVHGVPCWSIIFFLASYDVLVIYDDLWWPMMCLVVLLCSFAFYNALQWATMFYDALWCSMMFYD